MSALSADGSLNSFEDLTHETFQNCLLSRVFGFYAFYLSSPTRWGISDCVLTLFRHRDPRLREDDDTIGTLLKYSPDIAVFGPFEIDEVVRTDEVFDCLFTVFDRGIP